MQPLGSQPSLAAFTNDIIGNVRTGIDTLAKVGIRNIVLTASPAVA